MQNFGVKNKEHFGMLWYFMEWSFVKTTILFFKNNTNIYLQIIEKMNMLQLVICSTLQCCCCFFNFFFPFFVTIFIVNKVQ